MTSQISKLTTQSMPEGTFVFVPAPSKDGEIKSEGSPLHGSSLKRNMLMGKGKPSAFDLPPALSLVPTLSHKFRFLSGSNTLVAVQAGTILGALGTIGTVVNSKVNTMASAFRVKSVKIWPPAGNNCFIEWATSGGYTKDEIKDSSLPTGVTVTKSLTFQPPRKSLLAFWINDSIPATALFNCYAPTGSIIDLNVEYTICGAYTSIQASVVSSAVGSVYYLALDGPTNHFYPPVGLPTTF